MNFVTGQWTNTRIVLFLLALLGFRWAAAEVVLRKDVQLPDTQLYEAYALAMYRGQGYTDGRDGARRAPGYPLFLATVWKCTGCDPGRFDREDEIRCQRRVLMIQVFLSVVTCWLVYRIGRHLVEMGSFPQGSEFGALWVVAIDPYGTALSVMVLSETLFAFALVLGTWLAMNGGRQERKRRLATDFALGVVAAAAVMVRPSGLLLMPVAAICWLVIRLDRQTAARLIFATIGFCLAMAPWVTRNAVKYGSFVPTALNVGESLYDGLNPNATGASNMAFLEEPDQPAGEVARDRYWWNRAAQWSKTHPKEVVTLAAAKFFRFWSPWPNEERFRNLWIVVPTTAIVAPMFVALLLGSLRMRRNVSCLLLGWLPALYFCGLHMVFVSSVRYRVPAMPSLALLAGVGLCGVIKRSIGNSDELRPTTLITE